MPNIKTTKSKVVTDVVAAPKKTLWIGLAIMFLVAGVGIYFLTQSHAYSACRTSTLKVGSRGDCVATLQRTLSVKDDAIYGNNTKARVVRFQTQYNLKPDGIVGNNTWTAICKAMSPGGSLVAHSFNVDRIGCLHAAKGKLY